MVSVVCIWVRRMKNDILYNKLKALYGEVHIANEGEVVEYTLPYVQYSEKHKTRWIREVTGGERYYFKCPFCGKPDKCWIPYCSGSQLDIEGPPTFFCRHVMCYRCEFEKDEKKKKKFWKDLNNTVAIKVKAEKRTTDEAVIVKPTMPAGTPLWDKVHSAEGIKYALSRGFDPDELGVHWGAIYSEDITVFRHPHIVFPIYQNSELVSWQARFIGEDYKEYGVPKYMFPRSGCKKASYLYNMDKARLYNMCVITEGITDTHRIGANAVCIFGKSVSKRQAKMIRTFWRNGKVILALDADALDKTQELVDKWQAAQYFKQGVFILKMEKGMDPASYTREEIHRKIKEI